MRQIKGFFSAIGAYFTAFDMLSRSGRFLTLTIVPFLMNMLLFISFVYLAAVAVYPWLAHLLDSWAVMLPGWMQANWSGFSQDWPTLFGIVSATLLFLAKSVAVVGKILFALLVVIMVYFTYSIAGSILMAPFLDEIAFTAENMVRRTKGPPSPAVFMIIFRALANAVKMIMLLVLVNLVLMLLNLIPVAGQTLYIICNYIAVSFMIGFQFMDFPFERRLMRFRAKLKASLGEFGMTCGLGAGVMLGTMIPVFGFLVLALSAGAAGVLYVRRFEGR